MTRIETELYDLAETIMRNDDMAHENDYHTIYGLAVDVAEVEEENAKLKDENAKLRKLMRMQDECIVGNCKWCKYRKNRGSLDVECELDDLARELGIEADDV